MRAISIRELDTMEMKLQGFHEVPLRTVLYCFITPLVVMYQLDNIAEIQTSSCGFMKRCGLHKVGWL